MNILTYCLAALLAVLAVLNFTTEYTTRAGKIINLINSLVTLIFVYAILTIIENKVLSVAIIAYMLSRYIRKMRFEADLFNDKSPK